MTRELTDSVPFTEPVEASDMDVSVPAILRA
jgi:hypothetical protein